MLLALGLRLRDDGRFVLSALILNGNIVTVALLGDGSGSSFTFDEASGWSARAVVTLGAALDGESVGVSEFDMDVLLVDAGEFAVKLVAVLYLLDIKAGSECLEEGSVAMAARTLGLTIDLLSVLVKLIEEAEEGVERGGGSVGNESSWEERHVACCVSGLE